MTAKLVVTKETGQRLLDSSLVAYGLVKSGNMTLIESFNMDGVYSGHRNTVYKIYGFSVTAVSPVVFISGRGVLFTSRRSGNQHTFYFSEASVSTKFYVFDLMQDIGSGARLATWDENGVCTFNSRQVPMNVVAAVTPPLPPQGSGFNGNGTVPYSGGEVLRPSLFSEGRWFYPINSGRTYAAFLPWNRGARCFDWGWETSGGVRIGAGYTVVEGAYGASGGVYFSFVVYPYGYVNDGGYNSQITYDSIAANRVPMASVIDVTNLPVPFDVYA